MEEESKMVLRTEDLVKKYGKRTVVSHVSINVKQGEIVGLLGPNGAGKTTSFYMTVGLITPNEGRIFLDDLDITKYPVYKRAQTGIGYLAQEASVFRQMSVEDNIAAVLEMTDRPLDYQKDKLESLIAEFRLQKVRKNKGNQLSGGERRRTEIARCLAIDPKFIMLDEPFAGVDPIAVEDIQQIVWKLKDRNIGILITDHNVQETLSITDRAYLLFEGKILFQGTPEELAENKIVREKYLSNSFVLRRKDFMDSLYSLGKVDSALIVCRQAAPLVRQEENPGAIVSFYTSQGVYLRSSGMLPDAVKSYDTALEYVGRLDTTSEDDRQSAVVLYNNLSTLHMDMKSLDKSEEYALLAVSLADKCTDKTFRAQIYTVASSVFIIRKLYGQAKEYLAKAIELSHEEGQFDKELGALTYYMLVLQKNDSPQSEINRYAGKFSDGFDKLLPDFVCDPAR